MSTRFCCCGVSGGCIYTAYMPIDNNDPPVCLHSNTEELFLSIPRPAYSVSTQEICLSDANPSVNCSCEDCYYFGVGATAASDIECRYSHYNGTGSGSSMEGENAPWVYTTGIIGNPNWNPGQLWPFALPQNTLDLAINIDGTSPCFHSPNALRSNNDAGCIANNYAGFNCSGGYWTRDPFTGNRRKETRTQYDVIEQGLAYRGNGVSGCASDIPADLETGEAFTWLDGFHRLSYDFNQYYWDASSQSVQFYTGRKASECLLAVFHRERWWDRYYNSLDDELPTDPPAQCRTPKRVAFACSGIPIFGFEILELHYAALNAASSGSPERIIEKIFKGEPMLPADLRAMESVGLLELKDWRNEPIDPNYPLHGGYTAANGEPIRKKWEFTFRGNPVKYTFYFAARPGGWSIICNGAALNDSFWPQIPRNSSSFTPNCSTIYPDFVGYDCMSAAPFPNPNETCYYSGRACAGWTPCSGSTPTNCVAGVAINRVLEQEAWASSCAGILFKYTQYYNEPAGKGTSQSDPWKCQLTNEATMAVVPNGSTSGTGALDLPTLRAQLFHRIPFAVSRSFRQGWGTTAADLCCGGKGIFQCGTTDCPAVSPTSGAC